MGLPIARLIIATNRNDVLHRVMTTSTYGRQQLSHTLSPSMDITVSSNFERLLFDLYGRDGAAIAGLMRDFDSGEIRFSDAAMARARQLFSSQCVSDEETCADRQHLAAVRVPAGPAQRNRGACRPGCGAARQCAGHHPGHGPRRQIPQAIEQAGLTQAIHLPLHLEDLFERPERFEVLPNELSAVQGFMAANINA